MSIVIPAILPRSREDLDVALARLAGVPAIDSVQIDIVDGEFAKPPSWPYAGNASWELPLSERFRYDLDLMVREPEASIERWVALGASRITLHAESVAALPRVITDFKKKYGYEVGFTSGALSLGLALNITTPLSTVESLLFEVDYVQLMGIATIGKQGEPFDARVLPKIREIRLKHPELAVQIDGGVSLETAPELLKAGATRLIVGSALMHVADLEEEIKKFEHLGQQYGIYE